MTTHPTQRPVAPRLAALRAELKSRGLDGFLVPRADEHQGEYVPKRAERLAWLTSFTGSAGAAIVLADKAAVFVDGRYTLQVRQQTDTKLFDPRDLVGEGLGGWIEANVPSGAKLGYDPWLHTAGGDRHAAGCRRTAPARTLVACETQSHRRGVEGPAARRRWRKPCRMASHLAGEAAESKRTRIAEEIKKAGRRGERHHHAGFHLLAAEHARRRRAPHAVCVVVRHSECGRLDRSLHGRAQKLARNSSKHLGNAVRLREPSEFVGALDALKGKTVLADPDDRRGRDLRSSGEGRRESETRRRSLPTAEGLQESASRSKARARRISATARR